MLFKLTIIIITALIFNYLFEKTGLPGLLGMIICGVLLGPNVLGFINSDIMEFSSELRTGALLVILIRAGLGINRDVLNKAGLNALKMSIIPILFETIFLFAAAHYILNFTYLQSGIFAFVLTAVSPALIVPQMLDLKEKKYAAEKEVPTIVLAGASLDNIIALTVFGILLGVHKGTESNIILSLSKIPVSIILGIIAGILTGFLLIFLFKKIDIRATKKAVIFGAAAVILKEAELYVPIAGLISIMTAGFIILENNPKTAGELGMKFSKIWVIAEIFLFFFIGAEVDIFAVMNSGVIMLLIIFIGLLGRGIGVQTALAGSNLNRKERLFCTISYVPKATVQAAVGGIPLAAGVPGGEIILAAAVLSIIATSPIGAVGIKTGSEILLDKDV